MWCDGENHETGDYWVFDIPVLDLADLATEQLRSIIGLMENPVN
ncbi:hypothetical protein SDC9_188284 [bioreactor metagenome]|uniref:Uncharacterized protein n=1 Tax=bioreactor metagenome TaxID=1076179 RepID=A0A645HNW3_9ZZZZ